MVVFEWTETGKGEFPDIKAFRYIHPSADITAIDGKEAIGECEGCGKPVVQGDKYQQWEECITCEACSESPTMTA